MTDKVMTVPAFLTPLYLHEEVVSVQRRSGDVTVPHFSESVAWAKLVSTASDYEADCTVFTFINVLTDLPSSFHRGTFRA